MRVREQERAQKCAGAGVLHAYVCVRVGSCICKRALARAEVCMRKCVRVGSCICECMCKYVQTRVGACGGAYMRAHLRMRGRMSACAGERASDNFIHKINYIYVF